MKYITYKRLAQIVFLVVIPKKLIHASSQNAFVYDGKEFVAAEQCELVTKSAIPFYVVHQDLVSDQSTIYKGTLVSLGKTSDSGGNEKSFNVLKSPQLDGRVAGGTQKISLEFVDIATNWTIQVLESKTTPFDLNEKTLTLETTKDKINYRRCCKNNKCSDLPVFTISDNNSIIGKLAFLPSSKDFITSYAVNRTGATQKATAKVKPGGLVETTSAGESLTVAAATVDVPPVSTPQQKVICTKSAPLRIYNDSLKTVVYKAPQYLPVKVFQDWDGGPQEKTVKGYKIIKVQLTTGAGKEITGWAAGDFIKAAEDCKGMPLIYGGKDGEEVIPGSTVVVDSPANCCRFPTLKTPSANYDASSGSRYFGARRRDGKRAHAAADLLRPTGEKVLSIDDGKVLRKYHFYAGTYAIEVVHDSGYLARYGEVAKKDIANSGTGERIIKGQHIGNIGSLKMLHFEIYSNKASGPLTIVGAGKYWRRSDLLDPTPLLNKWQDMTF